MVTDFGDVGAAPWFQPPAEPPGVPPDAGTDPQPPGACWDFDVGAGCDDVVLDGLSVVVVGVSHGLDGFDVAVPDGLDVGALDVASVVVGAGFPGAGFDVSDVVLGAGSVGQSPDVVVVVLEGVDELLEPVVVVVVLEGADVVVVVVVVEDAEVVDGASTPHACWIAELTTVDSGADALVDEAAAELHTGVLEVSCADAKAGAAIIAPPAEMTLAVKIPVMRLFMVTPWYACRH